MKENPPYDLIVIGGGCNGSCVARDAAMRGLKTLLLEKDDFGNGTTGYSSHMIHGGLRYLMFDRKTTETSCLDAGYILKIAPHIMYRIPMLLPFPKSQTSNFLKDFFKNKLYTYAAEAFLRAYDQYQPLKQGRNHTLLTEQEVREIEPGLEGEWASILTTDEWWIDTFRLCLLNALSAQNHGATVKNGVKVEGFLRHPNGSIAGVDTIDQITGETQKYYSNWICNAAGPWVPSLAQKVQIPMKLRYGKGTHVVLDRRISNWAVATKAVDGRDIFAIPDHNGTLIGTTDDDFYGDLDHLSATHDEIAYLMEGIGKIYPSVYKARPIRAVCGVRPTLYEWGKKEENLSREHQIFDHEKEGVAGLVSMAGGKLASFRLFARETVDYLSEKMNKKTTCQTHLVPLPGGEESPDLAELLKEFPVSELALRRLLARHGSNTREILEFGQQQKNGFEMVCLCEPVLQCEIQYVLEKEMVRKVTDIPRRCRATMGPCQGVRCSQKVVDLFCEAKGIPENQKHEVYWQLKQAIWKEVSPCISLHPTNEKQAVLGQYIDLQKKK